MIAQDLYHLMREQISTGALSPGTRLDSVRTLATRHGMAHATAAKVLRDLARDGMITCHPGRGSFVTGPIHPDPASAGTALGDILFAALSADRVDAHHENLLGVCFGVQDALRHHGYGLRLASGADDQSWRHHLADPRVQGVVVANAEIAHFPSIRALIGMKPVVWCGIGDPPSGVPVVTVHDEEAGRVATNHVLDLGHHRVVFITAVDANPRPFERRYAGFRQALIARGLPVPAPLPWNVVTGDCAEVEGLLRRIHTAPQDAPTAFVVGNDAMAAEIRDRARMLGLAIPEQLSLTGIGRFAGSGVPHLTTIAYDRLVIGQAVAALVTMLAHYPGAGALEFLVPVQLIIGATTASPAM